MFLTASIANAVQGITLLSFDLKDFKERTNDEESLDDISLIVGQFSMTIFHTGYLHRLSDTQSCLCCYAMNLTVDNTENKRRRTQYIVSRARRSLQNSILLR